MDSSCTLHMCPRKDYFESLNLKEGGVVLLGNNKPCKVQGMGSIRLNMFNGYTTQIEHGIMKISNNNLVIAKGIKRNGLYILDGSTIIAQVILVSQNQHDKTRLWHVSEKVLLELAKQNLLNGDKMEKLEFCDHCILGKARRVSFEIHLHTISKPFEYAHSDL
ncbi:putative mitochondrial protein, partial [Mucuna pruriens]